MQSTFEAPRINKIETIKVPMALIKYSVIKVTAIYL